jgi:hypothetical protein
MNKNSLKQIIKEEILSILSESHKPGEQVKYKGGSYTVVDETPVIITLKNNKSGNIIKVNYNQFKKQEINESPYPLIPKKMTIADVLEITDLDDDLFGDQTKQTVINFIRNGRPSEVYLQDILQILKDNDVDTSEIISIPSTPKSNNSPSDYRGAQNWVDSERAAGRTSGLD